MKDSDLVSIIERLIQEYDDIDSEYASDGGDIDIYELPFSDHKHLAVGVKE